jgi:hypothetical protein
LYTFEGLVASVCDPVNCKEKKVVRLNSGENHVLHFRIDGVFICDNLIKKNDCFIVYDGAGANDYVYLLLIEVKHGAYKLDDVKAQLQNGRDILNGVFSNTKQKKYEIKDMLKLLPPAYRNDGNAQLLVKFVRSIKTKEKYRFIPILCAERKVDLLKRVGVSERFKVKVGNDYQTILFIEHKTDIIRKLQNIVS